MQSSTVGKATQLTSTERFCRQLLLKAFAQAEFGTLVIRDQDGEYECRGSKDAGTIQARIDVQDSACSTAPLQIVTATRPHASSMSG